MWQPDRRRSQGDRRGTVRQHGPRLIGHSERRRDALPHPGGPDLNAETCVALVGVTFPALTACAQGVRVRLRFAQIASSRLLPQIARTPRRRDARPRARWGAFSRRSVWVVAKCRGGPFHFLQRAQRHAAPRPCGCRRYAQMVVGTRAPHFGAFADFSALRFAASHALAGTAACPVTGWANYRDRRQPASATPGTVDSRAAADLVGPSAPSASSAYLLGSCRNSPEHKFSSGARGLRAAIHVERPSTAARANSPSASPVHRGDAGTWWRTISSKAPGARWPRARRSRRASGNRLVVA
jgi:hypothetical protein